MKPKIDVTSSSEPSEDSDSSEDSDYSSYKWDGWPDGYLTRNFTHAEVRESGNLMVHWASRRGGGDRKGQVDAPEWELGKKSTRKCVGVITCDNEICEIVVQPHINPTDLDHQLTKKCSCGGKLVYEPCSILSVLHTWSGGVHYANNGHHLHRRPTHILHFLPNEKVRFEKMYQANPTSGPLKMQVGIPTLNGPGDSAIDITPLLLNADRIAKERSKMRKEGTLSADGLIAAFSAFSKSHPHFVRRSTLGEVTVISVQTSFMRSQLVKDKKLDGPINGMVSDAAHGWWKERTSLLIVSSTYCPVLRAWAPGVLSYSNGASGEHFQYHFLAVLEGIAEEAESRDIPVTDTLFAGVMDFSEAERVGFVRAFTAFWESYYSKVAASIIEQLSRALAVLLLLFHPRALTRILNHERLNSWTSRTRKTFREHAALLVRDYPHIASWMEWWTRPVHAAMLFESERKMDIEIWNSIPRTTNAEESMHWKLYSACGRDHAFLEGMHSLYAVAVYYERMHEGARRAKIRYGKAEAWKDNVAALGRTKRSREDPSTSKKRQSKSDGRPPDTIKELLLKPSAKKSKALQKPQYTLPPSYPWSNNSCWLDTSLQVLFMAVSHLPSDYTMLNTHWTKDSPLRSLFEGLLRRLEDESESTSTSKKLRSDHDLLRKKLKDMKIIKTQSSFESLFVWFTDLISHEGKPSSNYRGVAAFDVWTIEVHVCTGSEEIGGPHREISYTPRVSRIYQASSSDHEKYEGSLEGFIKDLFILDRPAEPVRLCWRNRDNTPLCTGKRTDHRNLLSIPILLGVETPTEPSAESDDSPDLLVWNIPERVALSPLRAGKSDGEIVYDLFALALTNGTHFIARYFSLDHSAVYTYDGMKNKGIPVIEPFVVKQDPMFGPNLSLPVGYTVHQVFYSLRGGLKTQEAFFKERVEHYSTLFNLRFSTDSLNKLPTILYAGSDLNVMDEKDRFWLSNSERSKRRYKEYITHSTKPTSIPRRHSPESEEETLPPRHLHQSRKVLPAAELSPEESHVPAVLQSHPSRSHPPSFISCRCGLVGNPLEVDDSILYGPLIRCDECEEMQHIACQQDGRAYDLSKKEKFVCDTCDLSHLVIGEKTYRASLRRKINARTAWNKPLAKRLRAGRGALARIGDFWYPVRLIEKSDSCWRVQWWRGNMFEPGVLETPGAASEVNHANLVDSLWMDRSARRKIRLGKWKHAHAESRFEDRFDDPLSMQYTPEVHDVLLPSKAILSALFEGRIEDLQDTPIPALEWLRSQKKPIHSTLIPFVGGLSVNERLQITNWFERNISLDPQLRMNWMGLLPLAHAYTVYLAARLRRTVTREDAMNDSDLLTKAWEAVHCGAGALDSVIRVDMERECIERLEEEMFENSKEAGIAGHYQWGLDAGHHQEDWNPYSNLRPDWNHEDREGNDEELQVIP
ncbi:hypothetical protein CPC08DRAFT_767975 [Agrocybe pediades]|nr:hypothetical protein CPC08DRAFT_767975 [Agrocybe pediades]